MENALKNITSFVGLSDGPWSVLSIKAVSGKSIPLSSSVKIVTDIEQENIVDAKWVLKGFASNLRYTNRPEKIVLDQQPSILGKAENSFAAFIPMKKSAEWWLLTQDERRKIMADNSKHIEIGSKYLSAISRQLFHSRDIGEEFDFLTWFEFSPNNRDKFDELIFLLR
ncbi:MAG: chlorite dismutase family protein, partial [Bacteroidetes bacterium]|nr:chlorite dismutase family protein [Bacteroidota bacterium]